MIDGHGVIVAVGPTLLALLGYGADELLGRDCMEVVAPDHRTTSQRQIERKVRGRAPVTEEVTELIGRDGRPVLLAIKSFRLQQASGDVLLAGVAEPIVSANRVDLEADAAAIGIGDDMRVVGWNTAASRLTGKPADKALGRPCWEVLALVDEQGERICQVDCRIAERVRTGPASAPIPVRVPTVDGERRLKLSTLSAQLGTSRVLVHLIPSGRQNPTGGVLLTTRQHEVLALLDDGLTTAEIAKRLVLARTTVRNHIQAILRTLGCHSRLEAVAEARRLGLL